jgi:hypothetical protein
MSSLAEIEKLEFETLFDMSGGYVLEFTNASFQRFIQDTVGINVYDRKYVLYGDSKANRLRAIWHLESDQKVGTLLHKMLEYFKTQKTIKGEKFTNGQEEIILDCKNTINRLLGKDYIDPSSDEIFLKKEFKDISLEKLQLDSSIIDVLQGRIIEINKSLKYKACLSTIIMCGSVLEGILLGTALKFQKEFNQSLHSPKDKKTGKVLQFHEWTLNNLIDVAHDIKLIGLDVKKYSHSLRDFRNYIHPYQQMSSGFNPDFDTAQISWQVLKAAIADLSKN